MCEVLYNMTFQFKQFTVNQSKAAAKVGTDGVLLGAWANFPQVGKILDIGTGTGVIALIAAQRTSCEIYALDIDYEAFIEAKHNFEQSIWTKRMTILYSDFTTFVENSDTKFDYIVSNPPFFVNSLKSDNNKRNLARHADALPFDDLLNGVRKLLLPKGIFGIILPADVFDEFCSLSEVYSLYSLRKCVVFPNSSKPSKRVLAEFSFDKSVIEISSLILSELSSNHHFTNEYRALTKDFYLKF